MIVSELSPRTQVYRGITARLKSHVFKVCDVTFRCRYTLRNDDRDRADEHIRHLRQSPLCVRAGKLHSLSEFPGHGTGLLTAASMLHT